MLTTHRGGEEVLLDVGGQDSTEAFEDVGHSDEAREILDGMLVGTLKRQVHFHYLLLRPVYSATHFPQKKPSLHVCGGCQTSAEGLGSSRNSSAGEILRQTS